MPNTLEANLIRERWIRVPSRGYCPHSGLSRSALYRLIRENQIRSTSLRRPGQVRGTRLVYLPSVFEYLDSHAVGPEGNA